MKEIDSQGPDWPDQTRVTSAEQRLPIKDYGSRIKDQGSRIKDQRSRTKDQGFRIKDQGSRIKDQGSRIKDQGYCFGMNEHPGRDTDVISRLSKCTIEDLSFYIGFTRIGSRIKDLGPCFGTNGHPRRATDMILRLSKSTTEDLSVFMGFRRGNRVKRNYFFPTNLLCGNSWKPRVAFPPVFVVV